MRVAYFLVFVFFVAVAISLYHRKPPETELVYHPDQRLLDEISFQQELIDSLLPLTHKRDTFIYERIKKIPVEVNTVFSLSADSSLRLFADWTQDLQDSSTRAGHLRIGSGSSNQ